jgi:hypothetical protein
MFAAPWRFSCASSAWRRWGLVALVVSGSSRVRYVVGGDGLAIETGDFLNPGRRGRFSHEGVGQATWRSRLSSAGGGGAWPA